MTSSYGPIITAWTVEQAVRDTLKAWIDTILGELERQSGGRWPPRGITRPRSWFIHSGFHDLAEQKLPAIHVESARAVYEHAADGRVDSQWPMIVQGVVKGRDRALARELLGLYEAACRVILDKKGDLGGVAAGVTVSESDLDLIPPDRDRTLVGFETQIAVSVAHVHNRFGGPLVPDDPPPTPLPPTSPEDPLHTATTVTVEGM